MFYNKEESISSRLFYFKLSENCTDQYSKSYKNNLKIIRPLIHLSLTKCKVPMLEKIAGLEDGIVSSIFGVIFKKMMLKPCVLDRYVSNRLGFEERKKSNDGCHIHHFDVLFIEDETSRIELMGNMNFSNIVTGDCLMVVGVKKSTSFIVKKVVNPGFPVQNIIFRNKNIMSKKKKFYMYL